MQMVERDHRIWACRPSTCTGDGGETGGGGLHEALGELCKTWPRRWDEYVQPALWIHRTTPDLRLPANPTAFRFSFGRDARTQLDATQPEIDGGGFRSGMHSNVADKRQAYIEVRDVQAVLMKRHVDRQKSCESRNATIGRTSVGTRLVVRDKVLVKEAESVMTREGIHHNLAHEHWTGTWEAIGVVLPGLSYIVTINGRRIRRRRASAAKPKLFHLRPDDLRLHFENKPAHLAWGFEFGRGIRRSWRRLCIPNQPKGWDGSGQRLVVAIQGTIRGRHTVTVPVRRGSTRQFHPFTAGLFLCAVGNVSRSGVPCNADLDANAE